ncbi:FGLLP motif-containing membrane protein [Streptomyces sp. NPDC020719]|uniref:FGLLP motif-containing membrane protein n=1 Tax=Streptomyces sp. NPDC020719 TaxID=3154896 RepID=UPI0034042DF8
MRIRLRMRGLPVVALVVALLVCASGPSLAMAPSPRPPSPGPVLPPPQANPHKSTRPPHNPATPVLSVSPKTVEQGKDTYVTVSGRYFTCYAWDVGTVTLTGDVPAPISVVTDNSSGFSQQVKVAKDAAPGVHTVIATCNGSPDITKEATYEVVAPNPPHVDPAFALNPDRGEPKTPVGVSGKGFLCAGAARVSWDGTALPDAEATPAADGTLTTSFTVPPDTTAGTHQVTVSCAAAAPGTRSVVAAGIAVARTFTVTQPPVVPPPVSPPPVSPPPVSPPPVSPPPVSPPPVNPPPGGSVGSPPQGGGTGFLPNPFVPGVTAPGVIPTPPAFTRPDPSHPAASDPSPTASDNHAIPPPGDPSRTPGPDKGNGKGDGNGTGGGTKPRPDVRHDRPAGLVGSVRTPAEISWALRDVAGSVGMALWFLLLVLLLEKAFPAQLAENAVGRWWRQRRRRRQVRDRAARLPGWVRMGAFAALGGVLVVWADATAHWGVSTLTKALGAAVGTLLILVTYEKTKDSLLRPGRGGVPAELRVVPAGLVLAVLMAALSRGLAFPVPYVYGLVAVYMVLGAVPPGHRPYNAMPKGQAVMIGGICVLSAALLVWAVGAPLIERGRTAAPGTAPYLLAYTVCLIVVGGIEVVVFGMLPLVGMDGHALKRWSRPAWYGLYLIALTLFFHVLLHSAHPGFGPGFVVSNDLRWCTLAIATGLFVAAWAFSLGLRGYVARLERRTAAVG